MDLCGLLRGYLFHILAVSETTTYFPNLPSNQKTNTNRKFLFSVVRKNKEKSNSVLWISLKTAWKTHHLPRFSNVFGVSEICQFLIYLLIFPLWAKWLVTSPMPTQYWHQDAGWSCGSGSRWILCFVGWMSFQKYHIWSYLAFVNGHFGIFLCFLFVFFLEALRQMMRSACSMHGLVSCPFWHHKQMCCMECNWYCFRLWRMLLRCGSIKNRCFVFWPLTECIVLVSFSPMFSPGLEVLCVWRGGLFARCLVWCMLWWFWTFLPQAKILRLGPKKCLDGNTNERLW